MAIMTKVEDDFDELKLKKNIFFCAKFKDDKGPNPGIENEYKNMMALSFRRPLMYKRIIWYRKQPVQSIKKKKMNRKIA